MCIAQTVVLEMDENVTYGRYIPLFHAWCLKQGLWDTAPVIVHSPLYLYRQCTYIQHTRDVFFPAYSQCSNSGLSYMRDCTPSTLLHKQAHTVAC